MAWEDQKAHEEELNKGAELARRWVNLILDVQMLSGVSRQEFDRLLGNLMEYIDQPADDGHGNSMGGPEPGGDHSNHN